MMSWKVRHHITKCKFRFLLFIRVFYLDCCSCWVYQLVCLTVSLIGISAQGVYKQKHLFLAPVEWLTLVMPFNGFQIYSEIRQGLFLTVLLTFWLFFAGEHIVVSSELVQGWTSEMCFNRIKTLRITFGHMGNISFSFGLLQAFCWYLDCVKGKRKNVQFGCEDSLL